MVLKQGSCTFLNIKFYDIFKDFPGQIALNSRTQHGVVGDASQLVRTGKLCTHTGNLNCVYIALSELNCYRHRGGTTRTEQIR